MSYKHHVFICTNGGDNPKKCASKGSEEMRKKIKETCQTLYGKSVRINSSGCLGYCEKGIACVIYSEEKKSEWLFDLNSQQETLILEKLQILNQ